MQQLSKITEGINQIIDAINSEESEEEVADEVEEETPTPEPVKPIVKKKSGVMQKLRNVANNLTATANEIP
jgi:hypothetical protein